MYRPDDKDIDRLSREAAERYHAPGNPSWDTLRETLERELPQEKEKKRRGFLFFFFFFIGLSLAGTTIWYGIHTSNSNITKPAITKNNPAQSKLLPEPTPAPAPGNTSSAKGVAIKSADLPLRAAANKSATVIIKNTNAGGKAVATAPKTRRPNAGIMPANGFSSPGNNQHIAERPEAFNKAYGDRLAKSKSKLQQQFPYIPAVKENAQSKRTNHGSVVTADKNSIYPKGQSLKNNRDRMTADKEPLTIAATIDDNDTGKTRTIATVPVTNAGDLPGGKQAPSKDLYVKRIDSSGHNLDSAKTAGEKRKNKSNGEKAMLFGLTAGFDFSTVKFSYGSNAGYNFGLMGGYQFNKHWAVLTGIIYTKKNYKLNGTDYHPPKHDWTQYVDLQQVDGFCRMWEIPVEARYTFNAGAKNVFFANAGLSSYFMKKQQYDYYYKNNTGMSMVAPWHNDSTFTHVFSILDLSVGLQKSVSKHLDLLIEPYAKIPLGGVGFGNIRLSSFGVNLTVQYKKQLKR